MNNRAEMQTTDDRVGFEYKSEASFLGWPLLHISFSYRSNGMPVPSKGIISIGQFSVGVITISQFGLGVISVSQITVAAYALAQIALAYSLVAQVGLYINEGYGQVVLSIAEFRELLAGLLL